MRFLRTNTAARVSVGPFFDKTDGVTPETALTVTSCKLTFMVDDANVPTLVLDTNPTASGGSNDMVHVTGDGAGFYDLELAAANVNYLGRAMLAITDAATHCPVFHEFMILPAMIYDSMILGTDRLDTNVTHVADTSQTARDLGASVLLSSGTGTGQLDFTSGVVKANATQWLGGTIPAVNVTGVPLVDVKYLLGTAWLTPGTAGTPDINVKLISGDSTAADNAEAFFDGTGYAGTNNVIPVVTTLTNLPAITTDWITAAGVSAGAVTKIQSGLATAAALVIVDGIVDDILDDTGTSGVKVASASKTGYTLSAAGLDSVVIETNLHGRQALSIIVAACAGVLAGAATTSISIAAAGVPATNRISATVDSSNNRTAVTLNPPA